jgi:hypothetical protein
VVGGSRSRKIRGSWFESRGVALVVGPDVKMESTKLYEYLVKCVGYSIVPNAWTGGFDSSYIALALLSSVGRAGGWLVTKLRVRVSQKGYFFYENVCRFRSSIKLIY